jgi:hypothetical protein
MKSMTHRTHLSNAAQRLVQKLLENTSDSSLTRQATGNHAPEIAELLAADLVARKPDGKIHLSATGRAYLARLFAARSSPNEGGLDPFLAQHLQTEFRSADGPDGPVAVLVNDGESPLLWLARRKGRDGTPLLSPPQLQAGERLRADFTRAQLTPRVTANWTAVTHEHRQGGNQGLTLSDMVVVARQRVRHALTAAGPEFSGLLLDVCCFLKRLEDVERERQWPTRSAKVVLQLGLDRLARHYGLESETAGPRAAALRTWLAPDAAFAADGT